MLTHQPVIYSDCIFVVNIVSNEKHILWSPLVVSIASYVVVLWLCGDKKGSVHTDNKITSI